MSNPQVELQIAGLGTITLELDAAKAPKSVENFLAYVNKGHFNGTIFHRVIPGFMIQGGGFEPGMTQKPTDKPINNEANNGLKNETYTVATTRTRPQRSSSSTSPTTASSTTPRPAPRAGATRCSARSPAAPTSSRRSKA